MDDTSCNIIKTIVARLDPGDDLLLSILKCAERNDIHSGQVSLIGGLKEIVYGLHDGQKYKVKKKTANKLFEVLPTIGTITLRDGKLFAHVHIVAAGEDDGTCFGGHLMEGSIVYPMAEICIHKFDAMIDRSFDPKTNLWPIKF